MHVYCNETVQQQQQQQNMRRISNKAVNFVSGCFSSSPKFLTAIGEAFLQCCFTSTETVRTIRDWEPRATISHSSWVLGVLIVECCFTSTETLRTNRDREPRTATSTFTQLLNSDHHKICGFNICHKRLPGYPYHITLPHHKNVWMKCCSFGQSKLTGQFPSLVVVSRD